MTPDQRDKLYDTITPHLAAIAGLFKNPKVTLVVRAPDLSDGDVVLTDDDLKSVIASLEKTWTYDRHVVKVIREKAAV
jgi:hypothetical protein